MLLYGLYVKKIAGVSVQTAFTEKKNKQNVKNYVIVNSFHLQYELVEKMH